jgi:DNA-binding CsgD family transcriptional regulator
VLSDYEYSVLMLYVNGDTTVEIARKLSKDEKSVENAKTRMFRRLRESAAKFSDN